MKSLLINQRLQALEAFVDLHGYESYDPYDGLSCPLALKLLDKNQLGLRVWQQLVRLFPINVRPVLGIPKIPHTKTISDFSSAYALLYQTSLETCYREKTLQLLQQLSQLNSPTSAGRGWGLRFPFATRFVYADGKTPNIFQTINAIHAFLDGYDAVPDSQWLDMALQGFEFIEKVIGFTEINNQIIWNYWHGLEAVIYNVSGLMLGVTARLYSVIGDERYIRLSRKTFTFIENAQNPDGSWFYSEDSRGLWVDGFHTGYILEGLCRAVMSSAIKKDNECLNRGVQFYLENMFTGEGLPQYYPGRSYPIDVQNGAQAIQTLIYLAILGYGSTERILCTIQAVDSTLWNSKGYYNYKKSGLFTYTTPMHRWGTGPMFLALTYALAYLKGVI